jgi:hypothetical protein
MFFYMANPLLGHWKEWALKIKTFFGPDLATNKASSIGVLVIDLPASKLFPYVVPRHITTGTSIVKFFHSPGYVLFAESRPWFFYEKNSGQLGTI